MAYTNSVENGSVPLEAGTTFSRGLMWAAIAAVVFALWAPWELRSGEPLLLTELPDDLLRRLTELERHPPQSREKGFWTRMKEALGA